MTGRRALIVAEMTLREIMRRRGVIALLLLLPLAFYLIRRDQYNRTVGTVAVHRHRVGGEYGRALLHDRGAIDRATSTPGRVPFP